MVNWKCVVPFVGLEWTPTLDEDCKTWRARDQQDERVDHHASQEVATPQGGGRAEDQAAAALQRDSAQRRRSHRQVRHLDAAEASRPPSHAMLTGGHGRYDNPQ